MEKRYVIRKAIDSLATEQKATWDEIAQAMGKRSALGEGIPQEAQGYQDDLLNSDSDDNPLPRLLILSKHGLRWIENKK
jgi:hypothetical protein